MQGFVAAALHAVFSALYWLHAHTARPLVEWWNETVLGIWEESVKSVVREAFVQTYRFLNGASAWVLSVFDKNYAESLRSTWKQQQDWHSWWAEDRQSTLNAVVTKYLPSAQQLAPLHKQPASPSTTGLGKPQADGASTSKANNGVTQTQQQPSVIVRQPSGLWQRAGSYVTGGLLGRSPTASITVALATPVSVKNGEHVDSRTPAIRRNAQQPAGGPTTHQIAKARMPFNKSVVFEQPAGWGVDEGVKRTGLLEDLRLAAELCVTRVFDALRFLVRTITLTHKPPPPQQQQRRGKRWRGTLLNKSVSAASLYVHGSDDHAAAKDNLAGAEAPISQPPLRRTHSSSGWEGSAATPAMAPELSSAAQIIKLAGYPLELHEVVTDDGYVLSMERIPRRGGRDVVFFMHGVLDTSLTWVSSGVTGSQAFAAWDQGFDVWLGNSRSNPPRATVDPARHGVQYWRYTNNELGIYDMSSQIDHIHATKCRELRTSDTHLDFKPLLITKNRPATAFMPGSASILPGAASKDLDAAAPGATGERLFGSGGTASAAAAGNGSGGFGSLPLPRLKVSISDSKLEELGDRPGADAAALVTATSARSSGAGSSAASSGNLGHGSSRRAEVVRHARSGRHTLRDAVTGVADALGAAIAGGLADVPEQQGDNWEDGPRSGVSAFMARTASRLFQSKGSRGSGDSGRSSGEQQQKQQQQQQQQQQGQQERDQQQGRMRLFGWGGAHGSGTGGSVSAPGLLSSMSGSSSSRSSSEFASRLSAGSDGCQPHTPQNVDSPFRLADDMASPTGDAPTAATRHGSSRGRRSSDSLQHGGDSSRRSSDSLRRSSTALGSAAASPTAALRSGSFGAFAGALAAVFGSGAQRQEHHHQQEQVQLLEQDEEETYSTADEEEQQEQQQEEGQHQPRAEQPEGNTLQQRQQQGQGQHLPRQQAEQQRPGSNGTANGAASAAKAGMTSAAEALSLATADTAERAALDAMPLASTPPQSCTSSGRLSSQHSAQLPQHRQEGQAATADAPSSFRAAAAAADAATTAAAADARVADSQVCMRRSQSSQAVFDLDGGGGSGLGRSGSLKPHVHRPWGAAAAANSPKPQEPYNLRVVAHSLGGASMLMYLIMRYKAARPHHVRRLILLTPAGYHLSLPWLLRLVALSLPHLIQLAACIWRGFAGAVYIPTFIARLLTFKIGLDANRLPALSLLLRRTARGVLGGDRSEWERALQQPHYNAHAMPAVSLHQGLHCSQWVKSGTFSLFDYGSRSANMAHYGLPFPPDVGEEYWRIDIPVDISAGIHDGIIPVDNARKHYSQMHQAGVRVTYREFDYGHMDFTFSAKDELRYYVMSRLLRRN